MIYIINHICPFHQIMEYKYNHFMLLKFIGGQTNMSKITTQLKEQVFNVLIE